MKPALVTGASGFLGWHVARALVERGYAVRALCRPGSTVRELDAEVVPGDLRDAASMERAVAGCELVFHVAADYRLWVPRPEDMYRTNVEGTRNVLAAAGRAGAERIVYTSTVGCIGVRNGHPGDESTPVSLADMTGHYKRSKWVAEQVAREQARAGLPVVIVNPTAPIGDHDWKPTATGRIVLDFLRGQMPAFIDTGLNVVHASDVAAGHLLAAERGAVGERYILGHENLTLQQMLTELAALTGRRAPTLQIPYGVAYLTGVVSTAWSGFTGKEPRAPLDGVRMARKKMFVRIDKAVRELGFAPQSARNALRDAVDWFVQNGYT